MLLLSMDNRRGKKHRRQRKSWRGQYDKQSLAIELALLDAGIELSHYIDGNTGTEKALLAAARAIGIKKKLHVVKAY
jgi:predicted ribonuclease YlaK